MPMLLDKLGVEKRLTERLNPDYFSHATTLYAGVKAGAMHSALTHEPIETYCVLSKERHGVSSVIQNMTTTNKEPAVYWVTIGPFIIMALETDTFGAGQDCVTFMSPNVLRDTHTFYATSALLQVVNAFGVASNSTLMNVRFTMEHDADGRYRVSSVRHDGVIQSYRFPDSEDLVTVRLNLLTGEFGA